MIFTTKQKIEKIVHWMDVVDKAANIDSREVQRWLLRLAIRIEELEALGIKFDIK